MPSTITINFMTSQHKCSVGVTAAFPDVCKTPAPPAPSPVPIPYPNIGNSSMASVKVTKRVGDDKQKVMLKGSEYSMTSGDEPGVAMGVVSNKIKGKSKSMNSSMNVKMEGKGVSRLTDPHGNNCGGSANAANPLEAQGPAVGIDTTALAEDQREACEKMKEKEEPKPPNETHADVAERGGMLEEDYNAIRDVCGEKGATVSFRDTNQACLPHLADGVPSKGHDVMTKTFDASNLGPNDQHLSGLVSDLPSKPPQGELIPDAQSHLLTRNGQPLTGDYDMQDMFDADTGARIRGGGGEDAMIDAFNDRIPGNQDRVMHGAQSNFGDFVQSPEGIAEYANQGKDPPAGLFQAGIDPNKTPPEGLTVFDGKTNPATVYRLDTNEDVVNFYRCQGEPLPEEWNYQDKKTGQRITK
jgi:hypothetical protein